MLFIILFALLMLAGALNNISHGRDKERICKYGYKDDQNEEYHT